MKPQFFRNASELQRWFEKNHDKATELWVGYHKVSSGKQSVTWQESVDEALCFGWIDSVRHRLGPDSYTNRFTPRKAGSTWSARNVKRVRVLIELRRMRPAGVAAFEARQENRTGTYSYEQRPQELPAEYERKMKANRKAWKFWREVAPSYRKAATWWVISAKKEETRARRLATLIETSAKGERVPPLRPPGTS